MSNSFFTKSSKTIGLMLTGMVSSLQKQTQSVAMRKKNLSDHVMCKHEINNLLKESTHYRYWLHFLCQKRSPERQKHKKVEPPNPTTTLKQSEEWERRKRLLIWVRKRKKGYERERKEGYMWGREEREWGELCIEKQYNHLR